jgi:alpha-D-ribose 1-methylphosphonate 5-triphosphate synthase subunit PhnG
MKPATDPATATRQRWIGVLARAAGDDLSRHESALRDAEYQLIRAPADGRTGYSYLAGRDKPRAELAALADAHLQGPQQTHWLTTLIEPLAEAQARRRAEQDAATAASKVEFFTLIRGED